MHPSIFPSALAARQFMLAGNATITFKSKKSGDHFTFKVRAPECEIDKGFRFVSLMTGPDNHFSFSYFGYLKPSQAGIMFIHGGGKAKVALNAPGARAFSWVWQQIMRNRIPENLEIWHDGCCGRCGRKLTHPESIASGFGPECIQRFGAAQFACNEAA
jgi:hypothetical protein